MFSEVAVQSFSSLASTFSADVSKIMIKEGSKLQGWRSEAETQENTKCHLVAVSTMGTDCAEGWHQEAEAEVHIPYNLVEAFSIMHTGLKGRERKAVAEVHVRNNLAAESTLETDLKGGHRKVEVEVIKSYKVDACSEVREGGQTDAWTRIPKLLILSRLDTSIAVLSVCSFEIAMCS